MNFRARLSLFALESRETPGSVPVADPYIAPDPTPTTDPATTTTDTTTDTTTTDTTTDTTTTDTSTTTTDTTTTDPLLQDNSITKVPLIY
jgi:hypothetical protein